MFPSTSRPQTSPPPPTCHDPTACNNHSGHNPLPLPNDTASAPFKPKIRTYPLGIDDNGTGREELLFLVRNRLADGPEFVYDYKSGLGDPASANDSHRKIAPWAYIPSGTFYRQIAHDELTYEEHADRGFTHSIADNHLIITRVVDDFHQHQRFYRRGTYRKVGTSLLWFFSCVTRLKPFLVVANQTLPLYPTTTFYLSRSPKTSPVGLTCLMAIRADTWPSLRPQHHRSERLDPEVHVEQQDPADPVFACVRNSMFLPNGLPNPILTVNWYQAWGPSGKGMFVCSLEVAFHGILYIERALQRST
jgi:hypothetical protein